MHIMVARPDALFGHTPQRAAHSHHQRHLHGLDNCSSRECRAHTCEQIGLKRHGGRVLRPLTFWQVSLLTHKPTSTPMAQVLVVNGEDEDDAGLGACDVHSPGGAERNEKALLKKLFTSPSSEPASEPEVVVVAVEKTGSLANTRGAASAAPGTRIAKAKGRPRKLGASRPRMPTHVAQRPPSALEQEQQKDLQEAVPHVTETPSPARDEQPTPHGAERTPPASEQGQHTVEQVDGQSHRQTNNTHPALEEQGSQPHKRRRIETDEDQQQQDMEQRGGQGRTVVSKTQGKRRQPAQVAPVMEPGVAQARGDPQEEHGRVNPQDQKKPRKCLPTKQGEAKPSGRTRPLPLEEQGHAEPKRQPTPEAEQGAAGSQGGKPRQQRLKSPDTTTSAGAGQVDNGCQHQEAGGQQQVAVEPAPTQVVKRRGILARIAAACRAAQSVRVADSHPSTPMERTTPQPSCLTHSTRSLTPVPPTFPQISIVEVRERFMKVPGDQTNGVVGKGAFSHVTRLFDRERMALATSKQFRQRVSQTQRRDEVDALMHAGRHPNLVRALAYLERAGVVECIFLSFGSSHWQTGATLASRCDNLRQ